MSHLPSGHRASIVPLNPAPPARFGAHTPARRRTDTSPLHLPLATREVSARARVVRYLAVIVAIIAVGVGLQILTQREREAARIAAVQRAQAAVSTNPVSPRAAEPVR